MWNELGLKHYLRIQLVLMTVTAWLQLNVCQWMNEAGGQALMLLFNLYSMIVLNLLGGNYLDIRAINLVLHGL